MRMHHQRIWRRVEYGLLTTSLLVFFSTTFIFGWLSQEANIAAVLFGIIYVLTVGGYLFRGKINSNMRKNAEKLGLKTIGLLKSTETDNEIHYEVHVLLPKKALGADEDVATRTAKVKRKLMLGFEKDIDKLHYIAKKHDRDVIYFGTSHKAFRKAWINKWREYGIGSHEGPCMDPWAAYTKNSWRRVVRRLYGKGVSVPMPKEEWRTLYTKIAKGDGSE